MSKMRKAALVLSGVSLTTALLGMGAAPASAASYGKLINTATGFCLDGNTNSAYMLACNSGNFQQWALEKKSNGYYQVRQLATLRCLDWSTAKGVYVNACNGGRYQEFALSSNDYGYRLHNSASNKCLDSNHEKELYVLTCNAGNYQRWHR